MTKKFKIFPRFLYTYRFIDLFYSFLPSKNSKTEFEKVLPSEQVYFFNSARAGLCTLLKILSQGKSRKIGIQPFTCQTVFRAIQEAGCIPVFVDINVNFTIEPDDLEAKKDLIDILVVTHTFGIPAAMDKIISIMSGKYVIEDCAHAFLSGYKNRPCGTWGDFSVFSINFGKIPSIGHGGFVLINTPGIKEQFQEYYNLLPQPGLFSNLFQLLKNLVFSLAFKPALYGLITYPVFKKMDDKYDFIRKSKFSIKKGYTVNRNVFFHNLNRYIRINTTRKLKIRYLFSFFPAEYESNLNEDRNFYILPLLRNDRDTMVEKLLDAGFEAGRHFSKSIEWAQAYGYVKRSCLNSEEIAERILTLPDVTSLTFSDIQKMIAILATGDKTE